MVDRKPDYLRTGLTRSDVVILVACYAGDGETLGIVNRSLAFAVNHVVYSPAVSSVKHTHIQKVFPEKRLVADLRNPVPAVLADDNHLR